MLTPLEATDPVEVGPYRLHGRLGSGGMGIVFQGFSPEGRAVAVKLPHETIAADPEFRSRFRQEVEAARRVRGGFVAEVLDADVEDQRPWMATEYVDGVSLADAVRRRGALEGSALLGLAVGLADALVAIHAAGVVHRDLKPSNIIMAWDGPKVIDFGIARLSEASHRTATGVLVGTVAWMAPEQLAGDRAAAAADVFAWAACVAFASTGRHPFAAESQAATVGRILGGVPDLTDVAGPLDGVIRRSLEKRPESRPTATELVATITGRTVVNARDARDAATHFIRGAASWPRHQAAPGAVPPPRPTRIEGGGARGGGGSGPWAGWQTPSAPGSVGALYPQPPPPPPAAAAYPPVAAAYPPAQPGYGGYRAPGHPQPGPYHVPPPYGRPSSPRPPALPYGRPIRSYLWQSIVLLILCWPTGIPAVVHAAQVAGRQRAGDQAGALLAARKARFWCVVSAVLILGMIAVVVVAAVATNGDQSSTYSTDQ